MTKRIPKWLLPHKANVTLYVREGRHGPEYGKTVEVKCRVEPHHRRIVRAEGVGNEITTRSRMFIYPDVEIPIHSLVEFDGHTYEVVEVGKQYGAQGLWHHTEALLL